MVASRCIGTGGLGSDGTGRCAHDGLTRGRRAVFRRQSAEGSAWSLFGSKTEGVLLNDFTRGVDVKAKASIHRLVRELAGEGMAICITSSDLEELLGVADRIVCMRGGRIVADRPSADFDKLSLLALASTAARRP